MLNNRFAYILTQGVFKGVITLLLLTILTTFSFAEEGYEFAFFRHPAVSSDGEILAFSYGGDIWTVSVDGGKASRITTHPAYEHSPRWSPDGKWLAFSADRNGDDDVFVIPSQGGQSRQLTFHESDDQICDWTPDNNSLIFSSRRDEKYPDFSMLYMVPLSGGTPVGVFESFGIEADFSSKDSTVLFTFPGSGTPWWRKHYLGSGSNQVWIYNFRSNEYTAVTDTGAHTTDNDFKTPSSRWGLWGADGSLFVVTEKDGTFNLWQQSAEGIWNQITSYNADGIRFPSISGDGSVIAYEHGTSIYVIKNGNPPRRLDIIAPLDQPEVTPRVVTYTNSADYLEITPDGKQMVFEVRGEIFAGRIVGDDEKAARGQANSISGNHPARESQFTISPGGDSLIFISDREGSNDLFLAYSSDTDTKELSRARSFTLERLTANSLDEDSPRWSPDSRYVAFKRGKGDLVILDLEKKTERLLLAGWSLLQYRWSPDGKWIAYAREDNEYNSDIYIIPSDSGACVNVSRHPDEDEFPVWSADGRKLGFRSKRRENNWDIYFVFLRLEDHFKTGADWAEEIRQKDTTSTTDKDDKKKVKETRQLAEVQIDTTDIYRRIRTVTGLSGEEGKFDVSPDGRLFVFTSNHQGENDLYSIKWTGEELKRLTEGGTNPRRLSFSSDGKNVRFLTNAGQVKSCKIDGGKTENYPFDARVTVIPANERRYKFNEVWRTLDQQFYDGNFHGNDWAGLHDKYGKLIETASCERDFGDLVNMMLGELNASHMGYYSPDPPYRKSTGRLGVDFDLSSQGDGYLVSYVLPFGPCDQPASKITAGERILSLNGIALGPDVNINELLQDRIGELIDLQVTDGKKVRRIMPRADGSWTQGLLRYDDWVQKERDHVHRLSEGKLGYLHLRGMGDPSLARFEAELYSEANGKDGLVIDVRNNGGGWTTDWILAMLEVKRHAVTYPRDGGPGYPQGRLPLYSWVKPVIVLCNQYSFSNAEIFSHAIQTLQRGKLVGVPTPGGVISTSGNQLVDGSGFRIPLRGWYVGAEPGTDPERNMEGNGAVPDIIVYMSPNRTSVDADLQLEAAVQDLIRQVNETD